jgi:DNA repair proteins
VNTLAFGIAFKACASEIMLCQNHLSSDLLPSQAGLSLTRKLKEAGNPLDLLILDHIILTKQGYFSFKDEGLFKRLRNLIISLLLNLCHVSIF